jgi:hypothetical protein
MLEKQRYYKQAKETFIYLTSLPVSNLLSELWLMEDAVKSPSFISFCLYYLLNGKNGKEHFREDGPSGMLKNKEDM